MEYWSAGVLNRKRANVVSIAPTLHHSIFLAGALVKRKDWRNGWLFW